MREWLEKNYEGDGHWVGNTR